ncbi:MAG TPA: phage major capsid protein [Actinophytocola sp.]|jgi:HK97 family phage major capsid protein|nr:phage major capsid protein [Actinophytocola sp.]
MSDTVTLETMATDIRARLDAIDKSISDRTSDEALTKLVRDAIAGLSDDEKRKLQFGGGEDRKLVGTKYARWGLSIADVEHLHDLQSSLRGQRKINGGVYEGPSESLANTFEAISDAYYLSQDQVRELDRKALDDLFPRIPLSEFHGKDRALAKKGKFELTGAYQRAALAMDTAESGFGSQLVGAQYVGELWEAPRKLGRVFPLIDSFEMTDPTAYLPVEVDIPEMLYVAESTTFNATNYATSKTGSQRVQVDAKKFVIHQMWSGEMEEDSIIAYIPFLRRQASMSVAHYSDSLVLNGDTTNSATGNINLDDADPADTKHYLAFDGIRHAALVDNTGNAVDAAGAPTLALLNAQRGKMIDLANKVDWGHPINANELVHLADPETADKLALLDDVLTVDKYGQNATILNGELAKILGNPLVSTIAMSKTEADGKVSTTANNNTKGQISTFNTRGFKAGWRRRVMVETERLPATDQTRIVYSMRLGFGRFTPSGAASGIEAAAALYNLSI